MNNLQERLNALFPAPRERGLLAKIAVICGVSAPTVTNWFSNPEKVAAISRTHAELICQHFCLDDSPLWLAEGVGPRKASAHPIYPNVATSPLSPSMDEPIVQVPVLANSGSMGGGNEALHEDVMVGSLTLAEHWVSKTIRPSRPGALRFIHGYGDSMSPTFEDGDVLLVDTGVRDPQTIDGVYVLSANNRLYIKRVRCRMDGNMEVSSDNATVKTVDVLNGKNTIDVLGRVVWCWNGRKL